MTHAPKSNVYAIALSAERPVIYCWFVPTLTPRDRITCTQGLYNGLQQQTEGVAQCVRRLHTLGDSPIRNRGERAPVPLILEGELER
jgi:hypothetical protein